MPAIKLRCEVCQRKFWASRRDTKYDSQRCRYRARMEDARFKTPRIPQSGVVGVTFNRIRSGWDVTIPEDGRRKYVGRRVRLEDAIALQKEILNG